MRKILFLFAILFLTQETYLNAQTNAIPNMIFNGMSYDVFLIKIDSTVINNFEVIENKSLLPYKDFVQQNAIDSSAFLINACISDSFCNPLGYYYKDSTEIQPVNLKDGTGNFYLKPNGALLFLTDDVVICESSKINNYKNIKLGIQSGPLLLISGQPNASFSINSPNKNIRCGVGIFQSKNNESYLVFATSNTLVSFYDFAMFFNQKFNCQNALCLESAGCIMKLPFISNQQFKDDLIICNYLHYQYH